MNNAQKFLLDIEKQIANNEISEMQVLKKKLVYMYKHFKYKSNKIEKTDLYAAQSINAIVDKMEETFTEIEGHDEIHDT